MNKKIIVALDLDSEPAIRLVKELKSYIKIFKVGPQLFSNYGPDIVRKIKKLNCEVFLDLKFCDIPNTVAKASRNVTTLGVSMFTVHTLGGREMLSCAKSASLDVAKKININPPSVLGVTILTSIDEKILIEELGIRRNLSNYVTHLAKLAKDSGLDGVIASGRDIKNIRKACGGDFIIVAPGIREKKIDDQKRVYTGKNALKDGADYIVIGRQIIEAEDKKTFLRIF